MQHAQPEAKGKDEDRKTVASSSATPHTKCSCVVGRSHACTPQRGPERAEASETKQSTSPCCARETSTSTSTARGTTTRGNDQQQCCTLLSVQMHLSQIQLCLVLISLAIGLPRWCISPCQKSVILESAFGSVSYLFGGMVSKRVHKAHHATTTILPQSTVHTSHHASTSA